MVAKRTGVSRILDANPKSAVLTDLPIPPVNLTFNRKQRPAFPGIVKKIRINILRDKSGSFGDNEADAAAGVLWLLNAIIEKPAISTMVMVNIVEMSGIVKSSGYQPVVGFEPANIPAQGQSPFAAAIRKVIADNEAMGEEPGVLQIDIGIGDWVQSGEESSLPDAIAAYRKHQETFCGGTYVFPVVIGNPGAYAMGVAEQVSVRYDPFIGKETAFDEIFRLIFGLIEKVSQNAASLQTMRSLEPAELQNRAG